MRGACVVRLMFGCLLSVVPGCSVHERQDDHRPTPTGASPALTASPTRSSVAGIPLAKETVAFTHRNVLYTALADGSDRRVITDFRGPPYPYAGGYWSPDGRELIIRTETKQTANHPGAGSIFKVSADGTGLVNLSAFSGSRGDAMPGWSPDGRHIVYAATKRGDAHPSLYIMDADGSQPRHLVVLDFEAQYPSWSSTGVIAFAGVVGNNFDIYSVHQDGSDLQRLTEQPGQDNWPSYSPDGDQITFFSVREGMEGIWVMQADGRAARFVAQGGEPNWSPDGRWITFDCGDAEHAVICAVRPDGTELVRLFGRAAFPAIRP